MPTAIPTSAAECLRRCLDIAEQLIADGRKDEALRYLGESVLPALSELGRAALRQATTTPPQRPV